MRLIALALIGAMLLLVSCTKAAKPEKPDAHYLLGVSYLASDNPTSALREFLLAAKIEPDDADLQSRLGAVYKIKKAYDKSEHHYKYALKLDPDNPEIQNNLAALYLGMDKYNDAIEYFQMSASNLLFARPEVSWTGIGYALFKKNDYPAALEAYNEAISVNWKFPDVYVRRGDVYFQLGQIDKAITDYHTALDLFPDLVLGHYSLALALMKNRDHDQAIVHFEKVVELAPDSQRSQQSKTFLRVLK